MNIDRILSERKKIFLLAFALIILIICCICLDRLSSMTKHTDNETIEKNITTLSLLEDDDWGSQDKETKIRILTSVMKIQAAYLGLAEEVKLEINCDVKSGRYYPKSSTICLSESLLSEKEPDHVIEVLFHELFYAAEVEFVRSYEKLGEPELLFFRTAQIYKNEMESYKNLLEEDGSEFDLLMESDAFQYSVLAADEFMKELNRVLSTQ